jgi:hypothetical protein
MGKRVGTVYSTLGREAGECGAASARRKICQTDWLKKPNEFATCFLRADASDV